MQNWLLTNLKLLAFQPSKLGWLLLAVAIAAADLFTKKLVSSNLSLGEVIYILPIFDLVLAHNSGAAFSFLADQGGWQRWFFISLTLVTCLFLYGWLNSLAKQEKWLALALTLILGGALGNFYDRLTLGYVVDFLSFHWQGYYFPAFNLADAAITCGAVLLLGLNLFQKQK